MSTTRRSILKGIIGGVSALVFPKVILAGVEKTGRLPTPAPVPAAPLPSVILPQTTGEFPSWICSGSTFNVYGETTQYGEYNSDYIICTYCGDYNSWKNHTCEGCGAPVRGAR